jgi:iron(III) transport system permease protein
VSLASPAPAGPAAGLLRLAPRALGLLAAGVVIAPVTGVFLAAGAAGDAWAHVRTVLLADYLRATALAVSLATLGCVIVGAPLAWLVAMTRFPGRGVFEWALVLPFAAPAYVAAYAYADLTNAAGPLQTAVRALTGASYGDYWFPEARGLGGAIFIYVVTLFPYVFLAARAAFTAQSICALEAARTLGASSRAAFARVALPLARPAIAAGAALAAMEIAAEYGAADHLGAQTLAVGVFRTWQSLGDLGAAARLSLFLVGLAAALVLIERLARGRAAFAGGSTRWRAPQRVTLRGPAALAATGACALALLLGFVAPVGWLIVLGLENGPPLRDLAGPLAGSLAIATLGAGAALLVAGLAAAAARTGGWMEQTLAHASTLGYAAPGAVVAIGLIGVVAALSGGSTAAMAGPAAIMLLAWAYAARFAAAGYGPLDAGLSRVTPSLQQAARALGARGARRFFTVDLPIAAPGLAAAALLVFVEALKELPATKILRPFNLDTLAVRAHAYAADERLGAAAWPALLIVAAGLPAVLWISRGLDRTRPGARKASA